jgi:serine-type D-Ala-D-Ala carboxypeptidase/endopeptidase (penicillin-binding protein 4)
VKPQPRFRRQPLLLSCAAVVLGVLFLFGPQARAAQGSALGQRVNTLLNRSEARRGFWGIIVANLSDGRVLYERDADHLFQPASNMKLFTTAAALEKLGPGFVFRTTVESKAPPDAQGRVQNLILVGRGDPNLSNRVLPYQPDAEPTAPEDIVFRELADQVAAKGVREVLGDIVADDRYFLKEPFSHDWSVEDLQWGYGAPVTALAFNDNSLTLHVLPGATAGEKAAVWLDPIPNYYQIDNRVETVSVGNSGKIYVERMPGSMTLQVWGQIPVGHLEERDTVAIADPPHLAAELFKRALEARGVPVRGAVRVLETQRIEAANSADPFAPEPDRMVLAEHRSVPLREVVKVINKNSQNLHAEMLLRTLGHEVENFGSLTAGLDVLQKFCGEVGLDPEETYFADGSGLSGQDLVSPRAMMKLLVHMANSPQAKDFWNSLPVAGEDGTLSKRFLRSTAAQEIHAKTGTLSHVNALSGYMELPSGKRLAFSVLVDNHALKSSETLKVLDAVVQTIYQHFGPVKRRPPVRKRPSR